MIAHRNEGKQDLDERNTQKNAVPKGNVWFGGKDTPRKLFSQSSRKLGW